jgi:hypothetical protein
MSENQSGPTAGLNQRLHLHHVLSHVSNIEVKEVAGRARDLPECNKFYRKWRLLCLLLAPTGTERALGHAGVMERNREYVSYLHCGECFTFNSIHISRKGTSTACNAITFWEATGYILPKVMLPVLWPATDGIMHFESSRLKGDMEPRRVLLQVLPRRIQVKPGWSA